MSQLPPLPAGFQIEDQPQAPSMPPLPNGFVVEAQPGQSDAPQSPYGQAGGYLDAAAQGIPVIGPLLQKAGAAGAAAIQPLLGQNEGTSFGQRYDANLSELQKRTQQFGNENPLGSAVAGLAGGTAALGVAMGAFPAIGGAMGLGRGSVIPNMIKGAATGAGLGATDAVARGQDPVTGAEWGGVFGGAGPAVGKVVGGILGGAASKIAKPFRSASDIAAEKAYAPLNEAGLTTPDAVQAHLDKIGPEAALVDANPRLTQYGGNIADSPGPGQAVMRDFTESRVAGAGDRILGELDQNMGKPVDLSKVSDQIHTDAKSKASPLYDAAYQTPIQSSADLDAALNTPFGKLALAKAKTLGLSEPNAPPSVMFQPKPTAASSSLLDWAQGVLDRGGPAADNLRSALVKSGSLPDAAASSVDVRGLHLTRQALDDMIQPAIRAGQSKKAAVLQGLRGTIDDTLKSVEPMAQADSIYSSQAKVREAMEEGLGVFRNNQSPEDIAAKLAGMSADARQGYLQGGRAAVRNVMGTARNDATAARSLFAKEFNKEKLAQLVGQDGASTVLGRIGAEDTYAAVNNRITGNSESASRLMGKADLADAHGLPSYTDAAIFSGVHGVVHRVVAGALKNTYNAITSGRQKDIELSLSKLLTASGVDRSAAIQQVMSVAYKHDPSGATNRLIAQIVARIPRPSDDQTGQSTPQLQISQ